GRARGARAPRRAPGRAADPALDVAPQMAARTAYGAPAPSLPGVGKDRPGCAPARAAGDSAPGVRARAAQVETADPGKPIACVAEEGPLGEELVERVLAMHRVPAAQAVLPLEVSRRDDVASDDSLRDARCVDLERPHGPVR